MKSGIVAFALSLAALGTSAPAHALSIHQCASGYHSDHHGHCQPDVAHHNRYCPTGMVIQYAPRGGKCLHPTHHHYRL